MEKFGGKGPVEPVVDDHDDKVDQKEEHRGGCDGRVLFTQTLPDQHEQSEVYLEEETSKDCLLGRCSQELWLVAHGRIETSEVLSDYKITGVSKKRYIRNWKVRREVGR